jgi:hypothetical protein
MTEQTQSDRKRGLSPTRRSALKIAAGAATPSTLGSTPVMAQTSESDSSDLPTDQLVGYWPLDDPAGSSVRHDQNFVNR